MLQTHKRQSVCKGFYKGNALASQLKRKPANIAVIKCLRQFVGHGRYNRDRNVNFQWLRYPNFGSQGANISHDLNVMQMYLTNSCISGEPISCPGGEKFIHRWTFVTFIILNAGYERCWTTDPERSKGRFEHTRLASRGEPSWKPLVPNDIR